MEVAVAKALKPSLRTELSFPQAICDEILCLNANNIVVGEDFSVDDLLDFSNGEFQVGKEIDDYEEEEDEEKDSITSGSSQSQDRTDDDSNSNSTAAAVDSDSVFASELAVPADDVADLEWVSHFVDDSLPELPLPELSLLYPVCFEQTRVGAEPEPRPGSVQAPFHPSPIPRKPRTKKTGKPIRRVWSFNATLSPPSVCSSLVTCSVTSMDFGEPPVKKQKKKAEAQTGGAQFQRRCSHCQVQKTPQWRTGPLGPKTLCNACGVRFKSGRLFPEYRPACSPTFSGDIHSNSHRKVLEMRRRKEMVGPATGSDRTQVVPSC
ncbi:hypothetical protein VNO77_36064 [Canavalia gladiata]|uniref:GATA transcription factor n=1 Tax=Canavalia gladiata TaxID=3824 RepID=A0AAN9K7I7_CANGL